MSAVGQTGAATDHSAAPDLPPIGSRDRYVALMAVVKSRNASRRYKITPAAAIR